VVTTDGLPLGYEVFAGNTHDSKTVETIVKAMEAKYGQASRIWVLDRGMISEPNLQLLRKRGAAYIVGTPKAMLRKFEQHLVNQDWHEVQAGVEVKLVAGPDGTETFILARSADRREKEKAMHQRFIERLRPGSSSWRSRPRRALRDASVAHQRLGRLKERYPRREPSR
jgi:transposase